MYMLRFCKGMLHRNQQERGIDMPRCTLAKEDDDGAGTQPKIYGNMRAVSHCEFQNTSRNQGSICVAHGPEGFAGATGSFCSTLLSILPSSAMCIFPSFDVIINQVYSEHFSQPVTNQSHYGDIEHLTYRRKGEVLQGVL